MVEQKARTNWLPPAILILLLAASGAAANSGWTLLGEPTADFFVVFAVVEAGLLGWSYFDPGLSRSMRWAMFTSLIAAPIVGLAFTDIGPVAAIKDLFRRQSAPTPQMPPPEFVYAYSQSEIIPDLMATKNPLNDWPGFRGYKGEGASRSDVRLNKDWKKHPPELLWKHPVGGGISSPVVVGEFLISYEQRGKDEVVACYEVRTGKQCWEHHEEQFEQRGFTGLGPQSTPTVANGKVFALGGRGLLLCLDGATGEAQWKVDLLTKHEAVPPGYGITASPLVTTNDDQVIVGIGGKKGALVSYDLENGRLRWSSGSDAASYSSPTWWLAGPNADKGTPQVLWFNQSGLSGYDPKNGENSWSAPWNNGIGSNACQPLVFSAKEGGMADSVMISAGDDAGCAAFVIEPRAGKQIARELWKNKNLKLKYSSAILLSKEKAPIAVGFDERILTAIDLRTGRRLWKHGERYGYGQLVGTKDALLIQAEDGRITLGDANSKGFTEHGTFQSVLTRTWNSLAISGDLLILRNNETLAVYQMPTESAVLPRRD